MVNSDLCRTLPSGYRRKFLQGVQLQPHPVLITSNDSYRSEYEDERTVDDTELVKEHLLRQTGYSKYPDLFNSMPETMTQSHCFSYHSARGSHSHNPHVNTKEKYLHRSPLAIAQLVQNHIVEDLRRRGKRWFS